MRSRALIACVLLFCASSNTAAVAAEAGDMACSWSAATGCSVNPTWLSAVWPVGASEPLSEYRSQLTACASHSSRSDCLTASCAWYPERKSCRPRNGHWIPLGGPGVANHLAKLIPQQEECAFAESVLNLRSCVDLTDCSDVKGCVNEDARRLSPFSLENADAGTNVTEIALVNTESLSCPSPRQCRYADDYIFMQVCDDFEATRSRCVANGGDIFACFAAACPAWKIYWDKMGHCASLETTDACAEEQGCYYDYYYGEKLFGFEVTCFAPPMHNMDTWVDMVPESCPHKSWIEADQRCHSSARSPERCAQEEGCEWEEDTYCGWSGPREQSTCWANQTYVLEAAKNENCQNEQVLSVIRAIQAFDACGDLSVSTQAECEMVSVPQLEQCPSDPTTTTPLPPSRGNESASMASKLPPALDLALLLLAVEFFLVPSCEV